MPPDILLSGTRAVEALEILEPRHPLHHVGARAPDPRQKFHRAVFLPTRGFERRQAGWPAVGLRPERSCTNAEELQRANAPGRSAHGSRWAGQHGRVPRDMSVLDECAASRYAPNDNGTGRTSSRKRSIEEDVVNWLTRMAGPTKTRMPLPMIAALAALALGGAMTSSRAQEPIRIGFSVSLTGGLASS